MSTHSPHQAAATAAAIKSGQHQQQQQWSKPASLSRGANNDGGLYSDPESGDDMYDDPRSDEGEEEVFSNPSDVLDEDAEQEDEPEGYFSDGTGATSSTSASASAGPASPGSSSSRAAGPRFAAAAAAQMGKPMALGGVLGLQGLVINPATPLPSVGATKTTTTTHGSASPVDENEPLPIPTAAYEKRPSLLTQEDRTETIRARASPAYGHPHAHANANTGGFVLPTRSGTLVPSRSTHSPAPIQPATATATAASPSVLASVPLAPANELPTDPALAESVTRGLFATPPPLIPVATTAGTGTQQQQPQQQKSPILSARRLKRLSAGVPGILPSANIHSHRHSNSASASASASAAISASSSPLSSPTRATALFSASATSAAAPPTPSHSIPATNPAATAPTSPTAAAAAAAAGTSATPEATSIFERDIEHRSASHLLTKQEAVDVAIPSVLADAVEALVEFAPEDLEIVEPQPPTAPLALSTLALNSHTLNTNATTNPSAGAVPSPAALALNAQSQAHAQSQGHASPSPPLSYVSDTNEPPVGSLAAQIAEKLAPASVAAVPATASAPSAAHPSGIASPSHSVQSVAGSTSPRRRVGSNASSIASGSGRRSPRGRTADVSPINTSFAGAAAAAEAAAQAQAQAAAGGAGVPVTEPAPVALPFASSPAQHSPHRRAASPIRDMPATMANSLFGVNATQSQSSPLSTRPATAATLTSHPSGVGSASHPHSPAQTIAVLPTAMAFPALPLPNPYRSPSPPPAAAASATSPSTESGVATPAPTGGEHPAALSSISVDGAVIPGTQVATAQASLDGLADVIAGQATAPVQATAMAVGTEEPAPYSTRGSSSPLLDRRQARLSGELGKLAIMSPSSSSAATSTPGGVGTPTSMSSASASASKRLSFFSAADMINAAKGEVHTFSEAIRHSAAADGTQHGHGLGPQTGVSPASSAAMGRNFSGSALQQLGGGARVSGKSSLGGAIASGISTPGSGSANIARSHSGGLDDASSLPPSTLEQRLAALQEPPVHFPRV